MSETIDHRSQSARPTEFLESDRVILRPLRINDVSSRYLSWLNDPEVNRYNSHAIFPYSNQELKEYVKHSSQDRAKVILAICDKKTKVHIGNVSLQNIDWVARSAEFAILIGEKKYWGKGVGLEAGKLLVAYGFQRLGLCRIHCGTSSENVAMQRLALKLGMRKEGRRRQAAFKEGTFADVLEFAVLQDEWGCR